MAKKRKVIGSVCKAKEAGEMDYIKIRDDVMFKKGASIRLESKKSQLENLEKSVNAGKLSGEIVESIRERINKTPDWVRFELVVYE